MISLKEAKQQADRLTARLKELGVAIKHTQALEAIAAVHNHTDWNRFQASRANASCTEPSPGISEFLADLHALGVSAGTITELQLLAPSDAWRTDLLQAITTHQARAWLRAFFPKDEISFVVGIDKLMTDKYGFNVIDAKTFHSQICFVARPAAFISDIEQTGVEITGRDKLLAILEDFGPRWGDALTYVARTCRKQGVTFAINASAVANCERTIGHYVHAGVSQDTAKAFILAAQIRDA